MVDNANDFVGAGLPAIDLPVTVYRGQARSYKTE